MIFDFSGYRLRNKAYSEKPMTMLDLEPKAMLSAITEIALIETGSRSAREHWQQIQLRNLVSHATQRSAFWRSRIGDRRARISISPRCRYSRGKTCEHRSPWKARCCGQWTGFRLKLIPHQGHRASRSSFLFAMSMVITTPSGALLNTSWRGGNYRSIERDLEVPVLP